MLWPCIPFIKRHQLLLAVLASGSSMLLQTVSQYRPLCEVAILISSRFTQQRAIISQFRCNERPSLYTEQRSDISESKPAFCHKKRIVWCGVFTGSTFPSFLLLSRQLPLVACLPVVGRPHTSPPCLVAPPCWVTHSSSVSTSNPIT